MQQYIMLSVRSPDKNMLRPYNLTFRSVHTNPMWIGVVLINKTNQNHISREAKKFTDVDTYFLVSGDSL